MHVVQEIGANLFCVSVIDEPIGIAVLFSLHSLIKQVFTFLSNVDINTIGLIMNM